MLHSSWCAVSVASSQAPAPSIAPGQPSLRWTLVCASSRLWPPSSAPPSRPPPTRRFKLRIAPCDERKKRAQGDECDKDEETFEWRRIQRPRGPRGHRLAWVVVE